MAEFRKRLACVIDAEGRVVRGYLVEGCDFDGTNEYIVTWKAPLFGGEARTNFAGTIGSAESEPVEPGLVTVGLGDQQNELRVRTFAADGSPAPRSFHIACFRDQ
ncbi:hypothetical protein [Actinomadura sp. WMMA1423]|uniref:hypothetical protein n=1 Tax=Actinomadura sp. WMMA1423 TaxID=2591108 RepID=UPI00114697CF|nr:hypothetical protein [Actinomadura sp. WMMA1423]